MGCGVNREEESNRLRGNNYLWSRAKTIAVGPSYYQRQATISLQLETRCDYTRIWSSMIDPINYSMIARIVTHHLTRCWMTEAQTIWFGLWIRNQKTENNHLVKHLVRVGGPKVKDAPTILFRWANIGLIVQTTNFSQMADHQSKGLQLEVGAQRVPRLLVSHIWQSMMLHTLLEKNFNCGSILPHNLIMEGIH